MKALISKTGVGSAGAVVEFATLEQLEIMVGYKGTFARVAYTNHGAHARTHTWYPVFAFKESNCDFEFVASYIP